MESKILIKTNEIIGRYAVAKEKLNAGEVFLTEKPFAYGPKTYSSLLCLGCHKRIFEEPTLCPVCSWPVCGEECSQLEIHQENECKVFKESGVQYQLDVTPDVQLQCICPLRTLLVSEKQKETWESTISTMEAHTEERKAQDDTWDAEQVNVVKFLRETCKLSERFSEDLVQKVCGILTINCYEIVCNNTYLRGLYYHGALLSHNCVANTTHSISGENDLLLTFRTTVDISEGNELFTSYTTCYEPTMVRREKLLSTKYFSCDCARCADPTECNAHMSTLKCTKCDDGIILSTQPLDENAPWKCNSCDFGISGLSVQKVYKLIQDEIAELENMAYIGKKLLKTEKLLKKYKKVLHPSHAWNLILNHSLSQLYGRIEGYTMNMLSDILLERKEQLCRQVLKTLDIICPGLTRERGIILYELHVALLLYNCSRYQYKALTLEAMKEELRKVDDILKESSRILSHEPPNSPDAYIAAAADQSLIQLEQSICNLNENSPTPE